MHYLFLCTISKVIMLERELAMVANSEDEQAPYSNSSSMDSEGTFYRNGIIQDLAQCIYKYNSWIIALAVISIVIGILIGLTIIGLTIAWLPIWLGAILFSFAKSIRIAAHYGETAEFDYALSRMNMYFRISGILLLILLAIYSFAVILGVATLSLVL